MLRSVCLVVPLVLLSAVVQGQTQPRAPKSRHFKLEMTLPAPAWASEPGKTRLWVPVPSAGADQDVKLVGNLPEGFKLTRDRELGNEMLYFEGDLAQAKLPVTITYDVTR